MALEPITEIIGRGVPVPGDDIDTDRIIPARYMKCVTFDGLGEYLFYDVRKNEDGTEKQHPLNDPRFKQATILVCGSNFGCGSSREHAPQAIYHAGYRAVIAEGFAEIFFGNATQLGMPCVAVPRALRRRLVERIESEPEMEIAIDVAGLKLRFGGEEHDCEMRPGAQSSLVAGHWDPIADLLEGANAVDAVAERLPYMSSNR